MRTLLLCIAAAAVARGQQCVSTVAGVAPAAAAAASSAASLGLGTPFALAFSASQGLLFTTSSAGVWSLYALSGGNATILLCGGRQGAWAAAGVAALSTFFGAHVAVHPLTQAVYFDAHVQAAAYIQMIDAFGNLQVVAGGGAATDFSGAGVPALSASIASSVGVEDNALAFAADGTLYVVVYQNYQTVVCRLALGSTPSSATISYLTVVSSASLPSSSSVCPGGICSPTYVYGLAASGAAGAPVYAVDASNSVLHSLKSSSDTLQAFTRSAGVPAPVALWGVTASAKIAGVIYVADLYGFRVFAVTTATGAAKVVAGSGFPGSGGDGGLATAATLQPHLLTIDAAGRNLYISDMTAGTIRIVTLATGIITSVTLAGAQLSAAGAGSKAVDATLAGVLGVATVPGGGVDNATLYFPTTLSTVASVGISGALTTFAGVATTATTPVASGDGGLATSATLATISGVTLAPGGRKMLITGGTNPYSSTLRVVNIAASGAVGTISTLATSGGPGAGGSLPSRVAGLVASSTTLYVLGFNVPNTATLSPTANPTPSATRGAASGGATVSAPATSTATGNATASASASATRVLGSPSAAATASPSANVTATRGGPSTSATITGTATPVSGSTTTTATITGTTTLSRGASPSFTSTGTKTGLRRRALAGADAEAPPYKQLPAAAAARQLQPSESPTISPSPSQSPSPSASPSPSPSRSSSSGGGASATATATLAAGASATASVSRAGASATATTTPAAAQSPNNNTVSTWMVVAVDLSTGAVTGLVNGATSSLCGPGTFAGDGGLGMAALICVAAPASTTNLAAYGIGAGGLALSKDGATLFIADSGNHVVRALNLATNIITSAAGTGGASGLAVSSGPATTSPLNTPLAVAVHPLTGVLYIADTLNFAIRSVAGGTMTTVAGTIVPPPASSFADSPDLSSTSAKFGAVTGLAFGGDGALYIADLDNAVIRELTVATAPVCPRGFACSCGRNLVACTAGVTAAGYCAPNVVAAAPFSPGYQTVTSASIFSSGPAVVSVSQNICPAGSYCANGLALPCPAGTYGIFTGQRAASDCVPCTPGTYLAIEGTVGNPASAPPCTPCPAGTYAPATGSTNCSICPVSTYLAASGGTAPAACAACAAGTVALFGASGCYASQPGDGFASSPILGFFERPLPVPTNNLASTPLLLATATVALPIVGAALLPYLLYLLSTIRGCPRGYVRVVQGSLAVVDSYAIKAPQKDGQSPTMQRSAAGGAVFILIIGVVVALMCSTLATYFYANTLLQQALLPLTYAAQVSFKSLAFVVPLTSALPTGEPALAPIAADGAGGLAITLRAMGARCGTLLAPGGGSSNGTSAFSYSIAQGAFTYSTSFDTATFNAVHTLRCAACSFDSLSFVTLTFDGTCQAFAATVSAVGVGGGVSVSSASIFAAAPWSSASVTFPLTLQVVQDTILGTQRDSDSLWLGGASCTGLAVGSATNYDAPVAGSAAAITVTLKLALQSQYVGNTLTQITSTLKLFSAMSAWLSLLGAGAILLIIHNAAASRFAPAKPAAAAAAVKLSEQQQQEKMWSVGGPPPEVAAARASMAQPSSRMASTPVVASLPPTAIAEVGDAYADDGQRGGVDVVNPMRSVELDDAAAAAPLPPGWSEKFSRSRQAPYWLSDVDGAATWVRPTEPPPGVGY